MRTFTHPKFNQVITHTEHNTVYFYGVNIAKALGYYCCEDAVFTYVTKDNKKSMSTFIRNTMSSPKLGKHFCRLRGYMITLDGAKQLAAHSQSVRKQEFMEWIETNVYPIAVKEITAYKRSDTDKHVMQGYAYLNRLREYNSAVQEAYSLIQKRIRRYARDKSVPISQAWNDYGHSLVDGLSADMFHSSNVTVWTKETVFSNLELRGIPYAISVAENMLK